MRENGTLSIMVNEPATYSPGETTPALTERNARTPPLTIVASAVALHAGWQGWAPISLTRKRATNPTLIL